MNSMGGFFGHIRSAATLMVAAVTLLAAGAADARVAGLGSGGVRGLLPPALTRTAPKPTTPQPGGASESRPSTVAHNGPTTTTRTANRPGLVGGLAAGFLGAGLFGLLFGSGFFAGLGSGMAVLGLLLQLALFVLIARFAWIWWQRRASPALVGLSPRQLADAYDRPRADLAAATPPRLERSDYDAFERLLGEIRTAYGREDLGALRSRVAPDMLASFADTLARNSSRGLVNEISDVRLLQGDLSAVWREADRDYVTVALHYSLIDRMVERASDRVVEGDARRAIEANELWTFVRARGDAWRLSAIRPA